MQATQGFRLSPQQRRLWELGQNTADHCSQLALLIEGEIDPQVLRERIEQMVTRHEALRTGFYRQPGLKIPLQVISETGAPSWRTVDLQSEVATQIAGKIERELSRQRRNKLDKQCDSQLDVLFIRLSPAQHILALSLPCSCADTLTLVNMGREISAAFSPGKAAENDEPVQYLQFSEWQNELIEGDDGKAGLDYWNSRAGTNPQELVLPFVSALPGSEQETIQLFRNIDGPCLNHIEIATVEWGVSLHVFLLACWQTLLWRLTGQPEIQVGYVCDGRKFKELDSALGLFATTLPVELHLQEGFRFGDVLRRVDHRLNEVLNWQEYFLLSNSANESYPRSWPVGFEYVNWPLPHANDSVRISLHSHFASSDRFALKLLCSRDHDKLTLELAFDPSFVRAEFAENMLAQFQVLAGHAAEAPQQTIEDLLILSEEDKKLISGLAETSHDWPEHQDVVEVFEACAAAYPNASAVACEGTVLSYAELNERASRLSWYLTSLGVRPETRVLLLLPRSEEMVATLLSVLKAGAAYIPVEPGTPQARLQYLIRETGASFVITVEHFAGLLEGIDVTAVVLDRDQKMIAAAEPLPAPAVFPENLAYILFTSGSTGKPKGVSVERRQLQNYVSGVAERLHIAKGSHLAMVSSFAADLGNTMLFPALCSGSCLHLISAEKVTDAEALAVCFEQNKIEYLKIVPSHFSALLSASQREKQIIPNGALVFGGEALSWSLIDRVREIVPECRMLNHYGPTETTVGVSTQEVGNAGDTRWGATVPLGRPLPNSRLYILDEQQRSLPVGVPGELYIGGSGVCRGYWGRPELTAERFLPDPQNSVPGARVYRTGDRVRLLPDGTIEYLDRLDRQIKIRGFRVELGEIESAILEIPGVSQVAVELRPNAAGDEQLVAFIGAGKDHKVTADQLRNSLRNVLPDHMVPAAFLILETLPLTANGKIDRQSLQSLETFEKENVGFVSPREMGEEMLAGLWREVLGTATIGVHDNFFQLGGDSLIATQLVSRVRRLFQVELPVRIVFEAPTVSAMAAQIEQALSGHSQLQAPQIVPVDRSGELILSFGQERLWGIQQLDPLNSAYNTTAALRLSGPLKEEALEGAITEIIRRHEVLRTTFASTDGRPRQVIHPPAPVVLPRVNLTSFQGEAREKEIRRLANQHAERPFDLEHDPPLRLQLLNLDDQTNILLTSMHHIATDGWSQNIFIRELTVLYDCYCHDRPSPLPEPVIQYADFAAWQRQWLQGEVLENLVAYWRNQLAGAPEALNFPTDYKRPQQSTYHGSCVAWQHSPQQLAQLKQVSRNEGVTLFMTLLTAFYIFLHQYTGQDDIVVGTDIANRNQVETESMIGFFVNNLALRVNLSGDPTVRELLDRVRTTALGAYTHQDLPFATLVKALRPKRSLSHTPIFQTLFVLQTTPPGDATPTELAVAPVDADMTNSKFDLTLVLAESDQGLIAYWTYRKELFSSETISELGKDFNKILGSIPQHLDSPFATLLQGERKQKYGKNRRLSNKTIHPNQEVVGPAL